MSIRGRKSLCAAAVAALSCSLVLAGPTVASADPASQLAQAKAAAASADQAVTAARTELDLTTLLVDAGAGMRLRLIEGGAA